MMAEDKLHESDMTDHVFDQYVLTRKLGGGGFGTVWLADHRLNNKVVRNAAIKIWAVTSERCDVHTAWDNLKSPILTIDCEL